MNPSKEVFTKTHGRRRSLCGSLVATTALRIRLSKFVISNAKVTEYGGHRFLLSRSFENSATASWMSFSIERPVASFAWARAESLAFRSRLEIYVELGMASDSNFSRIRCLCRTPR